MKTNLSKLTALACAAGMALALTGCLRGDQGTVIGAVPTPTPTATPESTPKPTPEATPTPANWHTIEAASPDSVTLAFTGDVNFADDGEIMANYLGSGRTDFSENFSADLLAEMQGADLLFCNNEFCISDRGEPLEGKEDTFRAASADTGYWQAVGADIVSLANNHVGDFGLDALTDTLDNLSAAGIATVGAGRNLAEAQQAQYYQVNGMTIAFVAATRVESDVLTPQATADSPGVLYAYDPAETLDAIRQAKENADFVVVSLHWGTDGTTDLEQEQIDLATACADAGADLIVGSHPNLLQGAGWRGDVPVFYSLGNFWFNMEVDNTALLKVTLRSPDDFSCQILPCQQQSGTTGLLTDETDRGWVLTTMNDAMEEGAYLDGDGILQHAE